VEEIQEDVKFDQINILEKQLSLPAIKHKWVSRLITQKRNKNNLEQKKIDLKEDVLKTLTEKGIPTGIPKAALTAKVESSETIRKINQDLNEDIQKYGKENFTFKIMRVCDSKWSLAYYEIKEQIDKNVLLDENYYNGIINVRIGTPPKDELVKFKNIVNI